MTGIQRWPVDHKKPVTWSFDIFVVVGKRLNRLLNKQTSCGWFDPPCLSCHCFRMAVKMVTVPTTPSGEPSFLYGREGRGPLHSFIVHYRPLEETYRKGKQKSRIFRNLLPVGDTWYVPVTRNMKTWWRYQIETFATLLAICAGNSPGTGEFHTQRQVTRSFDVFFDLHLNKRLSKPSRGSWFETLSRPSWRHCNESSLNMLMKRTWIWKNSLQ